MGDLKQTMLSRGGYFEGTDQAYPEHFGNPAAEVAAARSSVVAIDRSSRGKLVFTGEDRARFLHGMLTNTVIRLAEGDGNHTALTDVKANTQADLWLYNWGDRLVGETEPDLQRQVKGFLDRYIIADDVEISDETDLWGIIGLHGPQSESVLADVQRIRVDLGPCQSLAAEIAGVSVRICRRTYTGESGFDLWIPAYGTARVYGNLMDAGVRPAGERAAEILRIEAGIPRYGVDVDDRVAPLEGGLADTVDFGKGCFIGQEVLAKMNNRGRPRRFLVGIAVCEEGVPELGSDLMSDERVVGVVKSGIRSESLGSAVCLASVRRGFELPGSQLCLADGRACRVVPLPFVKGKSLNTNNLNVSA